MAAHSQILDMGLEHSRGSKVHTSDSCQEDTEMVPVVVLGLGSDFV